MKNVNTVVRILLGIMLLIFGLNKFLKFMPMPDMDGAAKEFFDALMHSEYIMPIVAVVEIVTGILFLTNKYTALAAVVLFPVILNALLFHLFLDPAGMGAAALAMIMVIVVAFANKGKYHDMLQA